MPGVVVTTAVRTGPAAANVTPSATFFAVGLAERGPTDQALRVISLADFESKYGGYVSYGYLHPTIQTYFEEGGTEAYISRVVGASATAGTVTLNDTSDTPSIRLDAVGAGSWSSNLSVSVESFGAGVVLRFAYAGRQFYSSGEVTSAAQAVNRINRNPRVNRMIVATDLGGNVPAAGQSVSLSEGDDDRESITDLDYVTALGKFVESYGAGAVAVPGQSGNTVWTAMISHANANHRIALCAFDREATPGQAVSAVLDYGELENIEHAGFFYPWVVINRDNNVSMALPPEGYVAAKRSLAQNTVGPWQSYAGVISEARFVRGLDKPTDKAIGNFLDDGRVNALRIIPNRVRIYGARSASPDEENFRFLNGQEMLNYVVVEAQRVLEDIVFSPIDGRGTIFSAIKSRLVSLMEPLRVAGGLYEAFDEFGERIDYGYTVTCDESINPIEQLAEGLVRAKIGLRVSSVGDKIEVEVTKSTLTASVV